MDELWVFFTATHVWSVGPYEPDAVSFDDFFVYHFETLKGVMYTVSCFLRLVDSEDIREIIILNAATEFSHPSIVFYYL